ncbi:hypothetical protein ACFRI7_28525 [Streptomyces sp. NPDC056716]|uniref:hypothetical protein n=1 Tax=unclassified Streptomyces TaxID=2593676 RepID=UPI0036C8E259
MPPSPPPPDRRSPPARRLLPAVLALLIAVPLFALAHHARPVPYGDRLTVHAREDTAAPVRSAAIRRAAVEAYDPLTGAVRWRHARVGSRPLEVLPARGDAITLWDDGLITATDGRAVRWHRALPGAAQGLPEAGGSGVLRELPRGVLAVITPDRIAAYRLTDGDLRWVLPAREGCSFDAGRAVRHAGALLVAQPCSGDTWTAQLTAVDDLGRIVPGRTPLGNRSPGRTSEHTKSEKLVARHR